MICSRCGGSIKPGEEQSLKPETLPICGACWVLFKPLSTPERCIFWKGDIAWYEGYGYYIHKSMTATGAEVAQRCKRVATRGEGGKIVWLGDVPPGWDE